MKIKIHNYETNAARVIEYPGSMSLFINVHYSAWGFYGVTKAGRDHYIITDKFTGEIIDEITRG